MRVAVRQAEARERAAAVRRAPRRQVHHVHRVRVEGRPSSRRSTTAAPTNFWSPLVRSQVTPRRRNGRSRRGVLGRTLDRRVDALRVGARHRDADSCLADSSECPALKVMSLHVSPPSVRLPEAAVARRNPHGVRCMCQIDAKRIRGFVGSIERSIAPVESFEKDTLCQALPPSVVRKTPRSRSFRSRGPCAATNTRSGSRGSTTTRAMWCASSSPMCVHDFPASVERYMPSP